MPAPLKEEQIKKELFKSNIVMLDKYVNMYDLISFKCNKCNYVWNGRVITVRDYKCCPECRKKYVESPYGSELDSKERYYIKIRARQQLILKRLGGLCNECKCDLIQEPWKAEFHHIDPSEKDYNISSLMSSGMKHLEKELDKCVLLCANCHSKKHFDLEKYNAYLEKINNITEKMESGEITHKQGHPPAQTI